VTALAGMPVTGPVLGLVSPADLALALAQWLFCRLLLKFLSFGFFSSFLSSLVFSIQLDST